MRIFVLQESFILSDKAQFIIHYRNNDLYYKPGGCKVEISIKKYLLVYQICILSL